MARILRADLPRIAEDRCSEFCPQQSYISGSGVSGNSFTVRKLAKFVSHPSSSKIRNSAHSSLVFSSRRVPKKNGSRSTKFESDFDLFDSNRVSRCRPRMSIIQMSAVNPITKHSEKRDITHMQDYEDRLQALRELLYMQVGSRTEIYKRLNCNGTGVVSVCELDQGIRGMGIPWQQITGLTRAQLLSLFNNPSGVDSIQLLDLLGGPDALTPRLDQEVLFFSNEWQKYSKEVKGISRRTVIGFNGSVGGSSTVAQNRRISPDTVTKRRQLLRSKSTIMESEIGGVNESVESIEKSMKYIENKRQELLSIKMAALGVIRGAAYAKEDQELRRTDKLKQEENSRQLLVARQLMDAFNIGKQDVGASSPVLRRSLSKPIGEELWDNAEAVSSSSPRESYNEYKNNQNLLHYRLLLRSQHVPYMEGERMRESFSKWSDHEASAVTDYENFVRLLCEVRKVTCTDSHIASKEYKQYWGDLLLSSGNKVDFEAFLNWYFQLA